MGISFDRITGDIVQFISKHADDTTAVIVPTQRLVRRFVEQRTETAAAPKLFTYEEFFDSLIDTGGAIPVDRFMKSMPLRQAIASVKKTKLILKDDFERIKNITRLESFLGDLIGFYEEISVEQIGFDNLKQKGIYTDYEMHIAILSEVFDEYKKLLEKKGLSDLGSIKQITAITIPKNFTAIYLAVSGFLTNYEISAIKKISSNFDVHIVLKSFILPKKMKTILSSLGFKPQKESDSKPAIFVSKCFSYIDMASWVLKTVREEYYTNHTRLENIKVILPDESIAAILSSIDRQQFNFANGFSMSDSLFYRYFNTIYGLIDAQMDNRYKTSDINEFLNYPIGADKSIILNAYRNGLPRTELPQNIEEQFIMPIKSIYIKKSVSIQSAALELLKFLKKLSSDYETSRLPADYHSAKEKLFDELEKLSLFNKDYVKVAASGKDMLSYLLKRLSKVRYTDVGIGKVKVMGVLESRLLDSDVVIMPSLNDGILPNISKDPFLNSAVRKECGLPTSADKEELQRYYFESIINSSKRAYLAYIDDDVLHISRFLFDVINDNQLKVKSENGLSNYLFDKQEIYKKAIKNVPEYASKSDKIIKQLQDKEYSASSLDTYKLCPYKFYLKYIKRIKDKVDFEKQPFEIGNIIHKAFKMLFTDGKPINDENKIVKKFENEFNNLIHSNSIISENPIYKVKLDYFLYRMKHSGFLKEEAACDADKIVVESNFKIDLGVVVKGRIDRIDIYGENFNIIDYKTGKIEKFRGIDKYYSVQLPLYGYAESLKTHKNCSGLIYHNLLDFKREYWMKPDQIDSIIDDIKRVIAEILDININFTKTDKHCKQCCYRRICRRV